MVFEATNQAAMVCISPLKVRPLRNPGQAPDEMIQGLLDEELAPVLPAFIEKEPDRMPSTDVALAAFHLSRCTRAKAAER